METRREGEKQEGTEGRECRGKQKGSVIIIIIIIIIIINNQEFSFILSMPLCKAGVIL